MMKCLFYPKSDCSFRAVFLLLLALLLNLPLPVFSQNCTADAGSLVGQQICFQSTKVTLTATPKGDAIVPDSFQVRYVLTSGEALVIEQVNTEAAFDIESMPSGLYTIHTLVFDTATLNLSTIQLGTTTGSDVNALLVQGGGNICGSLDVTGVKFRFGGCEPTPSCLAEAGTLVAADSVCLGDSAIVLTATVGEMPTVPNGYQIAYVLTTGDSLVIQTLDTVPSFSVDTTGRFAIHTLVYDSTLDLSLVQLGVTTGFDINDLLVQGGGEICAALDVEGAVFNISACEEENPCPIDAGTLVADAGACLDSTGTVALTATEGEAPTLPSGYQVAYVLTSGSNLVIQALDSIPSFIVDTTGRFTIHTLVFDSTLNLTSIQLGVTTGSDVNALLVQGGGTICAALDLEGAVFNISTCEDEEQCPANAGTLLAVEGLCLEDSTVTLTAIVNEEPTVPENFQVLYILTSGDSLLIQAIDSIPSFTVDTTGRFTIHTLVYDSTTLNLDSVLIGQTSGFDINALLVQGGGEICAALDVAGATYDLMTCEEFCPAKAGTLLATEGICIENDSTVLLTATVETAPTVPEGYQVLYVLTAGDALVIQAVDTIPSFTVDTMGIFTIHTLVYDTATLDLNLIVPGQTTGTELNRFLVQGGGAICAALDVEGARFIVLDCDCPIFPGKLAKYDEEDPCLRNEDVSLIAEVWTAPIAPEGYQTAYILTSGDSLVIEAIANYPSFVVQDTGVYRIHILVYDSASVDLDTLIEFGITEALDLDTLLVQGGGSICASLDLMGVRFHVIACDCKADAGIISPTRVNCIRPASTQLLVAAEAIPPVVPSGFDLVYLLSAGDAKVIEQIGTGLSFTVDRADNFTIHPFVYNPSTLSLDSIVLGETTISELDTLIAQGGEDLCTALDLDGARFIVQPCDDCGAVAGVLAGPSEPICIFGGANRFNFTVTAAPSIPIGYTVAFVLTFGDNLVIEQINATPNFTVRRPGIYRGHILVYNPATLDLNTIQFGVTTGAEINALLIQGGGTICAALDINGTVVTVEDCSRTDVNAFPNPTTDDLMISLPRSQNAGRISIEMYDMSGSLLTEWQYPGGTESATLNISPFIPGMYFVKVKYDQQLMQQIQVAKAK